MRAVALIAALMLAGCATQASEPRVITKEVAVPVAVKCADDPGPEPVWVDTAAALKAAPDIFEKTRLLLKGRLQHLAWEASLKAANAGCR